MNNPITAAMMCNYWASRARELMLNPRVRDLTKLQLAARLLDAAAIYYKGMR